MAELQDGVTLTDLTVITRWSLAVRQPEAERAELIEALRADLAWLEGGRRRATTLPSLRRSSLAPRATEDAGDAVSEAVADAAPERAPRRGATPRRTSS